MGQWSEMIFHRKRTTVSEEKGDGEREECYLTGGIEEGQAGPRETRTKDERQGLNTVHT